MKKGKIAGMIAVSLISAIMLTGCIDAMPNMTDEQEDMIAEYAAGLLLKYSPNYDYRLVSDRDLEQALIDEQNAMLLAEQAAQEQSEMQTDEGSSEENTTEESNMTENEEEISENEETSEETKKELSADANLAAELGIEDVSIKYLSCEAYSTYPVENDGFSVSAAKGKKILVLYFDVVNLKDEDVNYDFNDYTFKGKVKINDGRQNPILTTMLVDDITSYIGRMSAGESIQLVATAEISEEIADSIDTVELQLSGNGNSCSVNLE